MKIKKEKIGENTKYRAETEYLTFEAELNDGGYGYCKVFDGGYEMDSVSNSALHNLIHYGEEMEEQYKLFTKFLRKIEKNHKIDEEYFCKFLNEEKSIPKLAVYK
jgi:arginyl-tRNA--protein-N-Asp/Glu arginylyltransferase